MEHWNILLSGAVIGLSISVPVGPMGVLCIRRSLTQGMLAGVMTGAGASTVQVFYCASLVTALRQIGPWLDVNRKGLSLFGAIMTILFAWSLLRTRQQTACSGRRARAVSLAAAYASAVALSLVNPMLLILLLGTTASIFGAKPPAGTAVGFLLLGQFAASLMWWVCLTAATALLRAQLSQGLLLRLNHAAAVALAGFGVVGLMRAAGVWH